MKAPPRGAAGPGPGPESRRPERPRPRLPKVTGADVELGNFILGVDLPRGSGAEDLAR